MYNSSDFNQVNYKDIFNSTETRMLIIAPDAPTYTIVDVNQAYLDATNTAREDLVGQSVFAVFPGNPTDSTSKNISRTIFSFEEAIRKKQRHVMSNYRYDIPIPGTDQFEERYWTASNTPIMDKDGQVLYFIHSPQNVTEHHKMAERERAGIKAMKDQEQALYSTFMQAPVGIAIFKGPDYIVDLINPPLCEVYGKSVEDFKGKPIFDVLTHARGQGFEGLLDHVRLTGESYRGYSLAAPLVRNGKLETVYLDFVYEPFREPDGTISGVIAVAIEVTDQLLSKQKIAEAEERARMAVDAVGLGTFDLDLKTGELVTSPRFAEIFGYKKSVPRKEYIKSFHPDDLEMRERAHMESLVTGKLSYEARIFKLDGKMSWIRAEGKIHFDEENKPRRLIGTLLDITEQRKAKEEQQKLVTLVDNSVDLMSILSPDGFNSYINDAGKKMLGFETDNEVKTTPVASLHSPQDLQFVQKEILPTVHSTGKWSGIMNVRHLKTGEVFPVFNNCIRIDDPHSGEPIGVGAVMRDLRPELAAKQALADSEQLLRNITTAAPTALWMSDETGQMNYFNETWIKWGGLPLEQNMGKGWLSVVAEEDRKDTESTFVEAIENRELFEKEFRFLHVDGSVHWCIANGQPQYKKDGQFAGYIGACVDITEQKYLQQQKDDFIGIASHELKTPVTSIKAYTQVLEKMLLRKGETKEAEMISKMDGQINRLTSLIGDLLDVTKINSGKLQFNDTHFDFNAMVADLIEDLQRTTDKHQLVEHYQETGMVFGDKERIGQVISNLITNAIKYSPHSSDIIISTTLADNEVKLCVQDFGIGIAEDKVEKVFEQFYRVSGDMQHTFPGLGLGLYISSEIIKREGGRIWVESVEGYGSTFCFALPANRDENIQKNS